MKIGIMTRWNVPSGQSSHAEPVGHAWLAMGNELKVFAAKGIDIYMLSREDEPFVHRCFVQDGWGQRESNFYFFDPKPFLEEDYEIFVMEMAYFMPMPEMLEIFAQIRKKAKTVLVVHETGLPSDPNWYKFEWDAIVCFDERYKEFMSRAFSEEKIVVIPFPCHPPLHGNQKDARLRLGLPLDKKIVFAYGFNILFNHIELFPVMERLARDCPVSLVLLAHHDPIVLESKPEFVILRNEMPLDDRLYAYLHACDAYINYVRGNEFKIQGVGVSSSAYMCLGAGCPVLVPSYCNFFDLSGKEVIKYDSLQQLGQRLRDVFEGAEYVKESLAAAEEYSTRNSGTEIAKQFIELFNKILGKAAHASGARRSQAL
jgi:glycosyltransferase involved in cell wall biosynthesis